MKEILYVEYDREYASAKYPWAVISSKIRELQPGELETATKLYEETKICDHSIVYDTPTWMFDFRTCGVCGRGLGTV